MIAMGRLSRSHQPLHRSKAIKELDMSSTMNFLDRATMAFAVILAGFPMLAIAVQGTIL